MTSIQNCVKCGTALPEPRGNRRRFCGPACRRTAEYEIRRLNRRLETMERDRDKLISQGDCGLQNMYGQTYAAELQGINRSIQQAEERLLLLLTEDETK